VNDGANLMTREQLLESAALLKQPCFAAADEFEAVEEKIAETLYQRMRLVEDENQCADESCRLDTAGRQAQFLPLYGINTPSQSAKSIYSRNFCRSLASIFHHYRPNIFVDTALWIFRPSQSRSSQILYWLATFDTLMEIAREVLSNKAFDEIHPFCQWLVANIHSFQTITEGELGMFALHSDIGNRTESANWEIDQFSLLSKSFLMQALKC
jgi:hypothetical protein